MDAAGRGAVWALGRRGVPARGFATDARSRGDTRERYGDAILEAHPVTRVRFVGDAPAAEFAAFEAGVVAGYEVAGRVAEVPPDGLAENEDGRNARFILSARWGRGSRRRGGSSRTRPSG